MINILENLKVIREINIKSFGSFRDNYFFNWDEIEENKLIIVCLTVAFNWIFNNRR